jgi:hypothetical protein
MTPKLGIRRAYRDAAKQDTKLNIGPGGHFQKKGWLTVDHYLENVDISCDLRGCPRLPLPSHSVSKIFCSHVIEHLSDEAVSNLFRECFRLLTSGGIVRFSCPDLEKAVLQHRAGLCDPENEVVTQTMRDAPSHLKLLNVLSSFRADEYLGIRNFRAGTMYSGGPIATEAEVERRLAGSTLADFARWAHGLTPDSATYRAHINAFWPTKVLDMMRAAGFRDAALSAHGTSSDEELRGPEFDNRPRISLFVEARAGGPRKAALTNLRTALLATQELRKRARTTLLP